MIAGVDTRTSTTDGGAGAVRGGSVLGHEGQVESDDGRPDCSQVRRLFEIRRGVFEAPRQDALGLSKVGQRHLQDAVGVGVRHRQALWRHGREIRTNHATSTDEGRGD